MRLDVDLKVDYAFKKVFGSPSNRDVLTDLLHAVLQPPPGRLITELELLNPFSEQDAVSDKLSIVDIRARDQGMRQFHVEMQMRGEWFQPSRVVYYWAKLHQQQLQ
jgi:predicted transposase/invertase (TIGR01784 family)